jgi:hypothetical protein
VDYISKPFQKEEVLIRIRTHLERDRLARELADLNAHLEQKVQERTAELNQKVLELEGRDRIAQHLLTWHSLNETLSLVHEVCSDIAGVSTGSIHLMGDGAFSVRAAIQDGKPIPEEKLSDRETISAAEMNQKVSGPRPVRTDDNRVWVPIPADSGLDLLGVIEVEEGETFRLSDAAMDALASFALQAAVAVIDAQVHDNAGKWKEQLDELLKMDDVVGTIEQLDSLVDERKADQ